MKIIKLKDFFCSYISKILFAFLMFFYVSCLEAQVINRGILYIGDDAIMYLGEDVFIFDTGSDVITSRATNHGKLQLGASATFSGEASNLFVDGFASTRKSTYFELPTGQGTTYAPIGVTNSSGTNGVDAAYYEGSLPSTVMDATVQTLPATGYWSVKGDNSILTLRWSSSISSLTNSIANLTVVGFNGTSWVAIASNLPTGNLTAGTIATSSAVDLSAFSFITLAERKISCAPLVVASGLTRTWNGTAWNVVPTLADAAVLNGNYPSTAGSFVCNSLSIGTNSITLIDGQNIEVVNDITGSGTITMSSTASVLQRNDNSTISPNIALTKNTRTNMRANDYIYWGSPLTTDSFSQLNGARAFDATNALVGTSAAFDLKYKYVSGVSSSSGGWQTLTQTEKGVGFIMRIKEQAPYELVTPYAGHIRLTFTGATNNGLVTVNTANLNATSTTSSRNKNLLGNPYPSAIDADKFLEYNTNLDGVVYMWRATSDLDNPVVDYIAYTRAGSTAESGIGADIFNGIIATGQGFKVKPLDSNPTGTVSFTNCMRISGNNNQFLRTNNTIDRFKVKITDANGVGNQILVAYMKEASLAYDRMYDATINSTSPVQLYSILDNDTEKLAINARNTFNVDDQIAVGYKIATTDSKFLSIDLAQKEGVFADLNTPIYLHDTELNLYHNFNKGAYSFWSNKQENNDRFKIVYQSKTIGNSTSDITSDIVANIKDNKLSIKADAAMVNVIIFDLTGKKLYESKIDNTKDFSAVFNHAQALYIAKVTLANGITTSIKLVNQN
jgi:hypothetical protein